ncbi:hypothetical protein COP1_007384 [Malus domestica]
MLLRPPSFQVFTETWLKKQALSCGEEVAVTVPFQFLHLWTSERFQPLIESPPKALKPRDASLGPPGGTKSFIGSRNFGKELSHQAGLASDQVRPNSGESHAFVRSTLEMT